MRKEHGILVYQEESKRRDPEGVRTAWTLNLLINGPREASYIKSMAKSNGLGFAPNTYVSDLGGLQARHLVTYDRGMKRYEISETGRQYLQSRGL